MGMWADLKKDYGFLFCSLCVLNYGGCKGMLNKIAFSGMLPYFQNHLRVGSKQYSDFYTVARSPWGAKGLWAMLSDSWPLLYYSKRYYIMIGACAGTFALVMLASVPLSAGVAAMMLFIVFMFIAMTDILIQGRYGQIMSQFGGSVSILTLVWGTVHGGSLIGSLFIGPMADAFTNSGQIPLLFWTGVPFAVVMIIPMVFNWLGEEPHDTCGVECKMFNDPKSRGPLLLAMTQSFLAVSISFFLLLVKIPYAQLGYCYAVSLTLVVWSYFVLPKTIANCNLYMYLVEIVSVSVQALQYYYRGSPLCIPDGPYFDNIYWLTFVPIMESLVSLAGVGVFEMCVKGWPARRAFWVTTAVKCFASLVDNFIILRWNTSIGIPDTLTYFIGGATIVSLVETLDFLPSNVIIGKLCPKSIEATVYAILAGFSNMGSNVAVVEGKVFQGLLHVAMKEPKVEPADCMNEFQQGFAGNFFGRPQHLKGMNSSQIEEYLLQNRTENGVEMGPRCTVVGEFEDCDISNLSLLVFCSQFIGPLLSVPFTWCLIPDVMLDGDFLTEEDNDNDVELAGGQAGSARELGDNLVEGDDRPPSSANLQKSTTSVLSNLARIAAETPEQDTGFGERYARRLSSASLSGGPRGAMMY